MMIDGAPEHSSDVLANVSVFRAKCPFCGAEAHDSAAEDCTVVLYQCACGHTIEMKNRTRWN